MAVVRRSAEERPSPPRLFWLVVALPVFVLWGLRAPLPDIGYDVLNYHLMHGERALRGPLFPPGDFYPYFFPYLNPAGDMVTAMFRWVLGYRAGTIVNALALVWAGEVLWRLLSPVLKDERVRAAAVLVVVATEGTLWEVSGYMVDLLALPVLLEATRIAIAGRDALSPPHRRPTALGFLLGTAVALKLTNLVFVLPIGVVGLFHGLGRRGERPRAATVLAAWAAGAATFALPIAPHVLLLLWKTGNPVFPYFNEIFASPYFPVWNIKDNRWGPGSGARALVWPLLSAFRPGRFSEFATTTGRLALGWVAGAAALVFFRRDERLRSLSVIVLFGGLFWSLGTGYERYGLFCELLGGLLLALVAARLAGLPAFVADETAERPPEGWRRAAAALLVLVATVQSAWAARLALRADWSDRPTVFQAQWKSAAEASLLFRDRDLPSFLSEGARERISRPLVWVDAAPKANGIMTLLAPAAPMIGLQVEAFIASRANLKKLDGALRACRGRAAYSLAFQQDADAAQQTLFRLGFPVASRTPVSFPFFSASHPIDLVLFEVALPPPLDSDFDAKVPTPWRMDTSLRGSIDEPVNGQEVNGDLFVRGWAREPGEDLLVTVLVGGVAVTPLSYRRVPRPDVAAVLPALGDCRWAGYEVVIPRPVTAPREVDVSVVFHSRSGKSRFYPGVRIRWESGGAPTRGSSSG